MSVSCSHFRFLPFLKCCFPGPQFGLNFLGPPPHRFPPFPSSPCLSTHFHCCFHAARLDVFTFFIHQTLRLYVVYIISTSHVKALLLSSSSRFHVRTISFSTGLSFVLFCLLHLIVIQSYRYDNGLSVYDFAFDYSLQGIPPYNAVAADAAVVVASPPKAII